MSLLTWLRVLTCRVICYYLLFLYKYPSPIFQLSFVLTSLYTLSYWYDFWMLFQKFHNTPYHLDFILHDLVWLSRIYISSLPNQFIIGLFITTLWNSLPIDVGEAGYIISGGWPKLHHCSLSVIIPLEVKWAITNGDGKFYLPSTDSSELTQSSQDSRMLDRLEVRFGEPTTTRQTIMWWRVPSLRMHLTSRNSMPNMAATVHVVRANVLIMLVLLEHLIELHLLI